jgi:methylenetetrahydrofolate reductase (NADH)
MLLPTMPAPITTARATAGGELDCGSAKQSPRGKEIALYHTLWVASGDLISADRMGRIELPERTIPATEAESRRALITALERPRYEILPLDGVADKVLMHVPRGIKVTITASPSRGLDAMLRVVERLSAAGYAVTPHLSARLVRDPGHLEELVRRLRSAGVNDLFVIAGDVPQPAGQFDGAAAVLSVMSELRERFAEVGISGYPESHHVISDEITIEAMFEKEPMATYIVSQICFEADVIATWVRRVRDRGTLLPIWIGVPGTVDNRQLLKISRRIGLGESARFLRAHGAWVRRLALARTYTPTTLVGELGPLIADPAARIAGFHIYTFNELERTEEWRRQLVEQLIGQQDHE